MGTLIAWIIGRTGWSTAAARAASYVLLAIALAGMVSAAVFAIRHDAVADHETAVVKRSIPATNKAATERADDAIANSKTEEERRNVIEAQPDQPIAPTSHALACKRLRDAGRHPASCG